MDDKQLSSVKNGFQALAEGDNFKLINGIGPSIEQRLHEAGLETFAQLAALSPRDIVELIGDLAGISIERIERQDWIGQASALAASDPDNPVKPATPNGNRQHNETFTISLLLDENNQVRRTRVVHVQDGAESAWAGWQEAQLKQFIVQHAGLRFATAITPTLSGKPSLKKLQLAPTLADSPGNVVRHSQPFSVHLLLDLSEVVIPTGIDVSCTAVIYAKNLGDNSYQIVGEAFKTLTSAGAVAFDVTGRAVPVVGLYRLEALLILSLPPDGPDLTTRLVGGELFQVY